MAHPTTTLILTYNDVSQYPAGVYESKNNTVYLHSQDQRYYERSQEKLSALIHGLDSRIDLSKVDNTIVYAGLNAMQEALGVALNFSKKSNTKLVACRCNSKEKEEYSKLFNIQIIPSECGGRRTLKDIIDKLLLE